MGLSTIFIIVCHAGAYIPLNFLVSRLFSLCNVGVDIFLCLSGIGLCYSLEKNAISSWGGVIHWYSKRYARILIPYLLITLPFTLYHAYLESWTFFDIAQYLSFVTFWTSHRGMWFIALLVPLYLVAPLLHTFLKRVPSIKACVLVLLCVIVYHIPLCLWSDTANNVLKNIQFCIIRVPSFIIGMAVARWVRDERQISMLWVITLLILSAIVLLGGKHTVNMHYMIMAFPLICILCYLLNLRVITCLRSMLSFMGKISLESYLFNVNLPIVITGLLIYFGIQDKTNYLMYSMNICVGTALSYLFHLLYSHAKRHIASIKISINE